MTGKINSFYLLATITCLLLLASCKNNILYSDTVSMPDNIWKLDNAPEFSVEISDTINNSNIFFPVRTGSDYPFSNMWLFVTTTSPNGISIGDTIQYNLADDKGNWNGKGFGDIHELRLPYKTNIYFPHKGTYRFKIQHGMRVEDLKGVYDIGLRIEKTSR